MFQSEFQHKMYFRFAPKIRGYVSILHKAAHKCKLLTAMVADDFAAGKKICSCLVLVSLAGQTFWGNVWSLRPGFRGTMECKQTTRHAWNHVF